MKRRGSRPHDKIQQGEGPMRHYGTAILFALVFSCTGARAEQTVRVAKYRSTGGEKPKAILCASPDEICGLHQSDKKPQPHE
jgi:hypothetical protein